MAGTHVSRWPERSLLEESPSTGFRREMREGEGMPGGSTDRQTDPAAATASLAAEAVLLEGRLSLLREAIDTVDARIEAVSEALRRLQRSVGEPAGGEAPGEASDTGLDP
ncbi:hypothetical protein ACIHAR_01250 [Streptomyces sp. NPDC052016]|uniref:hypothetical protein n=1 Tax=Streptomyces sp. NPDC052016 TaxID=3365680 RepID=UPI0037CF6097